jgi:hypothetical protein
LGLRPFQGRSFSALEHVAAPRRAVCPQPRTDPASG